MPDLYGFYLDRPVGVVGYDTFEIKHSSFSQTYRIVRNAADGLTATTIDGEVFFSYYPLAFNKPKSDQTLDQNIELTFGDLGEILPNEIDRVINDSSFSEEPELIYRFYRSDSLGAPVSELGLRVKSISFNHEGAVLQASAKTIKATRTGEYYTVGRFSMLTGFQ